MRALDLVGSRFGRLLAKQRIRKNNQTSYLCECDCGQTTIVLHGNLRGRSHTQSCGCLQRERTSAASLTHGESRSPRTPEYQSWADMIKRCEEPTFITFKNYGGRGIKVCKRWRESYERFLADMGRKPTHKHTLDRINVDGDYKPSNCRWATWKQQNNNKRKGARAPF